MLVGTVGRMSRRSLVLVAAVAAAALVAVCAVAVTDHTHKHRQRAEARRLAYICAHRGVDCGGPDPAAIEAAWNRRERIYVGTALALGLAVVTTLGAVLRPRRPAG